MSHYFEDLEVGQKMIHKLSKTITDGEHQNFCATTLNPQPLHISEDFAKKSVFGQRLVNGLYTLSLVVGITVYDLTLGTIIANLGYEEITHPNPVFHNDTIYVETEILAKRESKSRPNAGIIKMKHIGRNQDGVDVVHVTRSAMFLKRDATDE